MSGLLGVQLTTANPDARLFSKADFFESVDKKVLTRMRVEGEMAGEAFIAVSLRDAILLGGTLIMLPLVLAYTGYCYYVFRGKTSDEGTY